MWNLVLHISKHKGVISINLPKKETHTYPISILKHLEGLGINGRKWNFKLIRGKALPSTYIPKLILPLHHVTMMDGQSSVIYLLEWNQRIQAEPAEHCPWKSYPIFSQERRNIKRSERTCALCMCAHRARALNTIWGAGEVWSRYSKQKCLSIFCSLTCPTLTGLHK